MTDENDLPNGSVYRMLPAPPTSRLQPGALMTSFRCRAIPGCVLAGLLAACTASNASKTRSAPPVSAPTVAGDQIDPTPGDPIEKLLMSRTPGLWVGKTSDGGLALRIRGGSNSMYGNNEPLYILDGVPFQPGPEGGLTGINPHDIASVKVLKEAADITMYGSRGANGVIIIKTKRSTSGPPSDGG